MLKETFHGQSVAAKTLWRAAASEQASLAEREAWLLRRCTHPNVVRLVGTCLDASARTVLLLEWCDADLGAVLRERRGELLPEAVVKSLCFGLLSGLAACHALGVAHRDIKPANLLLGVDGRLKLGDFGSAGLLRCDVDLTPAPTTRCAAAPRTSFDCLTTPL